MHKAFFGGIGLACAAGFVWLIYIASKGTEQEHEKRLTLLGFALGFTLVGLVALEKGNQSP
ncbi:MAG TPA: hypothetical protein VG269_15905 [Tepidisphaeraceae bacterium]|jgi:hypothetical protein|nr:hypothetical protein [Tepidisphaeraceae bacterium]